MGRKFDFQEPRVVLHSFTVQLLLIKLIYAPNWDFYLKVKLSARIGLNYAL